MKPHSDIARTRCLYCWGLVAFLFLSGCGPETATTRDPDPIEGYQHYRIQQGPPQRISKTGFDSLRPRPRFKLPYIAVSQGPEGEEQVQLTIEQALIRALANNPQIQIVSYDPQIAKEEIEKALADFDWTTFGRYNYEDQDNPTDSIFLGGQTNSRLLETGIKQRNTLGTEWSVSYALTRNWDDLATRTLDTRMEPMIAFQLRQPLLRDGWKEVNLAGINISKLNHRIALAAFRQKTEELAAQVIEAYWYLWQTREDLQIQHWLLDKTTDSLKTIRDREGIDATTIHVEQAQVALRSRQSSLLQLQKRLEDVQDALRQLLCDEQLNLVSDPQLIPVSNPIRTVSSLDEREAINEALALHPLMLQAKLGVEIAEVNIAIAQNQQMPRLDLVASARMQGLDDNYGPAHDQLERVDYTSYAIGINFEYPLGNRQREAEVRKRRLERSKAISVERNLSDQLAVEVKEKLRRVQTAYQEMEIEEQATRSAQAYLQSIEDTELVRRSLTPEFLLVKLQAQEALANARRAQAMAVADFNRALVQLAQAKGTVLQLHQVQNALPETTQ